jgi:hemerythrin superfamily protein
MVDKTILSLMIEDHKSIIKLIDEIEKKGHFDIDLFSKFKWNMEKHIFTEEKAIFTSYNLVSEDDEDSKAFEQLTKEHNIILGLIDRILKEELPTGNISFNKLKKLLYNHRSFEEENIYPKLDQNLSKRDKIEITRKIKDMI